MRMTSVYPLMLLLVILLTAGCVNTAGLHASGAKTKAGVSGEVNSATDFESGRMLIWRANLDLEVADVNSATQQAITIAEQNGGYLEWKSERAEKSSSVRLRIPVKNFKSTVGLFEALGTVTSRSITGEDVTEKYIDTEARLKNKIVLRDRLTQLLARATDIKDILAIEAELNRVQSDIDAMEGIIKSLKGQIDYATVDLDLERKQILGPLGYLFKGLWWGVSKLFVVRD